MSSSASPADARLDGRTGPELAGQLGLPQVSLHAEVGSTLDVAHDLARHGAPAGTLVIADEQTAGRGRHGRRWTSAPGAGLWLTLVERPADVRALDVMSLRVGVAVAQALDELAAGRIHLKWPNDLYVAGRKLAGILIETRWRGTAPEWVAIGLGVNVRTPDVDTATGLAPGATRLAALERLVPALRAAASRTGHLDDGELADWRARDVAVGRDATEPGHGVVQGINAAGELLLSADGRITAYRSGSLTFAAPLPCS